MKLAGSPETQLLAASKMGERGRPFLTVAIPHYKYPACLEIVLHSLFEQTFEDFEILVSDDCSPDDSNEVIPELLKESGRRFSYYTRTANLGYDGNVRFCLRAARGRYVFLLGNDDALAGPNILESVAGRLVELGLPEVAFTNFEDWKTGQVVRKALASSILGSGPATAIRHFRSFSFVSGSIYDQSAAAQHETDRWDTSIYYQIYIGCRIVAAGGRLASLDLSAVRKDVRAEGLTVATYATKARNAAWSFQSLHTGLESVIRVTADAVSPLLPEAEHSATVRRIAGRVLALTYPFWLFEYRRVANWGVAAGVARGLWPGKLLAEYDLSLPDRLYLWLLYFAVTFAGLLGPINMLAAIRVRLAESMLRRQQTGPVVVH
jgi:glycosyltransferase involved in cell wall biosynthesis